MSFPILNGQVINSVVAGRPMGTVSTEVNIKVEVMTATAGYSIFQIPTVVDVSGMEFGVSIAGVAGSGSTHAGIASGVSTVLVRFCDLGTTGSGPASTNYLMGADNTVPAGRVSDFSNTPADGWTTGQMRYGVGTSTTDLDADDVVGLQCVANLTTAAGIGNLNLWTSYIYGKPGRIT